MDSWLAGVDAVSRVHSEMLCTYWEGARRRGLRFWYYAFLVVMAAVTWIVLPVGEPGKILVFTGILSVFAVAIVSVALRQLNYVHLPRVFPRWVRGGRVQHALFLAVVAFYVIASVYYVAFRIRGAGWGV